MPFVVWINVCSQQLLFDQWSNLEIIIFFFAFKERSQAINDYLHSSPLEQQTEDFVSLFVLDYGKKRNFSAPIQIFLAAIFIPVCRGLISPRELSLSQNRYRIQGSFTSRTYWLPRALVTQSPMEQSLLGGKISGAWRNVPSPETRD